MISIEEFKYIVKGMFDFRVNGKLLEMWDNYKDVIKENDELRISIGRLVEDNLNLSKENETLNRRLETYKGQFKHQYNTGYEHGKEAGMLENIIK